MSQRRVLTVSAGLPVLQQLDSGGTGTLVEGFCRGQETEVGTAAVLHRARSVHDCRHTQTEDTLRLQTHSSPRLLIFI